MFEKLLKEKKKPNRKQKKALWEICFKRQDQLYLSSPPVAQMKPSSSSAQSNSIFPKEKMTQTKYWELQSKPR